MKKLSLNAKIYLILSIFVLASIIISLSGLKKLSESKDALDKMGNLYSARITMSLNFRLLFYEQIIASRDLLLANYVDELDTVTKRIEENTVKIKNLKDDFSKILLPIGQKNMDDVMVSYGLWLDTIKKVRAFMVDGKKSRRTKVIQEKLKQIQFAFNLSLRLQKLWQ